MRPRATVQGAARRRILLATAESHPTHRPDVSVLFGQVVPEHGLDVDLVATTSGQATAPWPGGRAHLRAARGRIGLMAADLLQQIGLFAWCRGGAEALVVRDKPVLGAIGWLAARWAGIPFCYWMSYPLPQQYLWLANRPDARPSRLRRAWLRVRGHLGQACLSHLLVPRSDWLFVQSDAMLADQRTGPLHHDRVSVVPMGVDLQRCAAPADPVMVWSCPQTDSVPTDWQGCRVGVYLGTLDRNRELEVLIDATVQVVRTAPDFRLLIIGEADEPADVGALRRYAASRGALRWVHFTGRLPGAQALALAACAQLGLSPVPRTALTEVGSPTKAVEYLAGGLPVVCNDQPDQALVAMASGNGHLAAFSPDGFAQAIEQALCALRSPGAAARAAAARDWVRRHRSYEVIGAQLAAVLTEVIDGHPVRQSARIAPGSAGSR